MEKREDIALEIFRHGFNCAQAVLNSFQEDYDFNEGLALSFATGFGGGLGRLQKTCGAVTVAFMLISLHNVRKYKTIDERKVATYQMIQEFHRRFLLEYKSSDCRDLLNCDLNTDEGKQYMLENNLAAKVCENCVKTAARITDDLVKE